MRAPAKIAAGVTLFLMEILVIVSGVCADEPCYQSCGGFTVGNLIAYSRLANPATADYA